MKKLKYAEKIVGLLSLNEKRDLIKIIQSDLYVDSIDSVRSEIIGDNIVCPHCDESENIYGHGVYKGRRRFHCKACNKTFNEQTGTSVSGIKKRQLWGRFIEMTLDNNSIRKIANELGLARQTVLDWRHKVMSSIENIFTKEFHGVVEMDDILMRLNQKGRRTNFIEECRRTFTYKNQYGNKVSGRIKGSRKRGISRDQISVLLSVDRYGTIGTAMLKRGKIDSKNLNRVFKNGFISRLNNANTIVTDEAKAYVSVLDLYGFDHEHINAGKKQWTKGIYHLNTLNNADRRFKDWIKNNFSSVSTKYLSNYLGYFKMLFFVLKNSEQPMDELLKFSLIDNQSFERKRDIENQYQTFLKY